MQDNAGTHYMAMQDNAGADQLFLIIRSKLQDNAGRITKC